ncbi:penicillin-binding protein [Weizmannia acidilactici]|uniref:Penicillin-binding protein n=1 Tax=Weizmannia acidilactici TaxID=2607726 RepID=A0A5J4JGA1_9BACI|nr:PBP1A family penicillin-binding protein [Weizmannia acidilactici]GER66337.1 penicillin-binding protein [Weizmannia acidilactici]GER69517.1 penicillin-binding protein [Weizmannia acidilactici]GER73054.1 penicillin-binding protein [Weizmannia acidilactici]
METLTTPKIQKAKWGLRILLLAFFAFAILLSALAAAVYFYAKILGPPPLSVPQSTLYYAKGGKLIGETNSGQQRYWVPLKDISKDAVDATISIEDRNFYHHHGFDYRRMAGALVADMKAMGKVQGASTITQQYARNLFLTMDKTWERKLKEAFYTVRLESNYSKDQILEGYLNTINYGHGKYGIQAASQYYFGKDVKNLTLAEAAMLAGIPNGPGIYSPVISPEKAKQRQLAVLQSMVKNGYITEKQATEAANEPLTIVRKAEPDTTRTAPYFQDIVKKLLKTKLGFDDQTIALGGLRVYTTLDIRQQKIAEETVKETIPDSSQVQLGFAAINPKNGFVTALVGGRDYGESPYNRVTQATRQPGSTMKPLLYYAALNHGFTPVTMLKSEPTVFRFDGGKSVYRPHNFNSQYADGNITMLQALAVSDNIYAVKTHLLLGENVLVHTAKQFGLTTPMEKVPSLALGTSGVHLLDMVHAYSLLANNGIENGPVFITKVEDYKGHVLYEYKPEKKRVLNQDAAFVTSQMMTGMFDKRLNGYASVTGASIVKDITRPYAGKSGSTNTDSWMIGFSPQLVSGVWVGYDNGQEITLAADKMYAKKIWAHFMEKALAHQPVEEFKPPKGVTAVEIDPSTGKLATPNCPVARLTYFISGTEPVEPCSKHPDTAENDLYPHKHHNWLQKLFPFFK